ncbi:MAG: hypothetical protein ACXVBW_07870, partial [Bdellovibrionota bacterium]
GLQISGTLASFETNAHGEPVFLKFSGPVQLAREDREIPGQGADYHRDGYSTPLGAAGLTRESLESMGFLDGTPGRMELPAGFTLEGVLKEIVAPQGTPLIVTFTDCTVRRGEKIYYRPEWGPFDLACGTKIVAVFGGAADRARYLATTGGFRQPPGKQKTNLTDENRALNALYAQVREFRESENPQAHLPQLAQVQERLARDFPDDWLLRYELLELKTGAAWESELRKALTRISGTSKDRAEMIQRGLELL